MSSLMMCLCRERNQCLRVSFYPGSLIRLSQKLYQRQTPLVPAALQQQQQHLQRSVIAQTPLVALVAVHHLCGLISQTYLFLIYVKSLWKRLPKRWSQYRPNLYRSKINAIAAVVQMLNASTTNWSTLSMRKPEGNLHASVSRY